MSNFTTDSNWFLYKKLISIKLKTSLVFNKEIKCLCDTLSFESSAVVKWLNLNFLSLNFGKTKFIVFTHNYIGDKLNILYEDKLILKSESALFLGLEVENKLTFGNHISRLCRNFCKIQSVLFKLQFLPSHILLKLYHALVYPNLLY